MNRLWLLIALLACNADDPSTTDATELSWYASCGDPACGGYNGPFEGVPLCEEQEVGASCADRDASCDLATDCNQRLVCTDVDPTEQEGGCPISRARHKTDITYLDAQGLRRLREEAVSMRLATWRYRDAAPDSRPRLGFLLDDHPTGHAAAADGEHVDVYGLASLALAAMQAQQLEIAALRAQVEALEARLGATPAE